MQNSETAKSEKHGMKYRHAVPDLKNKCQVFHIWYEF